MLPIQDDPESLTFTELRSIQDKLYAEQEPALVRRASGCLDLLLEDPDDLCALIDVNDLSMELGALSMDWFEFSVAVFYHLMSFTVNSPRDLKNTFDSTLARLANNAA